MAKRGFAGSPPPGKSKKARGSGKASTAASPPSLLGGRESSIGAGAAGGTPAGGARSRSRSRSVSAAPTPRSENAYGDEGDENAYEDEEEDEENEDEDEGAQGEEDEDEFAAAERDNAEMKDKLRVLLAHFDEDQMDRYEAYRRSGLAKASVRKLVNQVLGQSVSPNILTVVRGFSKVFVGEIVEKARSISHHPGPLTPADIREAYRLYQLEHDGSKGTGASSTKRKLFVK